MATIYEVSNLAGVSLATVSRVMNKNTRVSDKTRDKVLAAMKELNYRPSSSARSLASNRSDSVGILVSELHGPFYGSMMSKIESVLRKEDKYVIFAAGHSEETSEKEGIEFLISRDCDAVILHVEAVSDDYLIELSKGKTPVVIINRFIPELAEQCISLDNELGGYLATKNMLEQGHTDFAYISGPLWKSDAKNRFDGHKRALKEHGLEFSLPLLFEGDFLESGGVEGMEYLLQKNLNFSALICANDEMASGALTTAREHGLDVPKDISLMGFDNTLYANYTYPKLTTIDYPVAEMGQMAAQWVLKNIYKKTNANVDNIFYPTLVTRDSVIKNDHN